MTQKARHLDAEVKKNANKMMPPERRRKKILNSNELTKKLILISS